MDKDTQQHTLQYVNIEDQLNLILGISQLPNCQGELSKESRIDNLDISITKSQTQQTVKFLIEQESLDLKNQASNKISYHHNLQKHTVTALRDILKINVIKNNIDDEQSGRKALTLWKQFLTIRGKKIMTRKFLSIFFSSQMHSVHGLQQYGFQQIFNGLNPKQILQAKIYLKKLASKILNDETIYQHVKSRQISKKQQFALYLINFRNELEFPQLKKRISKQASNQLKKKMQIFAVKR